MLRLNHPFESLLGTFFLLLFGMGIILLLISAFVEPAMAIAGVQTSPVVPQPGSVLSVAQFPTPLIVTPTATSLPNKLPFLSIPTAEETEGTLVRCAPEAPFVMPTSGVIRYMWDDSFRPGHRHTGLDIFGGADPGVTPVVAAYPGYLTRPHGWAAAFLIRIPEDPLQPGRQIWLYYTHMADRYGNSFISSEFPQGTAEEFVKIGTFLGYQGNFTGSATNPTGVHLHFSIVLSGRGGGYLNELEIRNTLDPSPYFGIPLNGRTAPYNQVTCGNSE